ncbi:opine metallophore biosynthesis dehydrogenase [Paenibacillus sp. MMS20-IR301]|uniref:opine metallophore biosynthesis dehydrogenase n=1 Tax=Paenibacillus sp. MMS20-IR301 TaxID=2895946 RepID=UPI0028E86CB9|nr:opine metallophore biosynthesis dehydrogenase [Paenibacillus sp. MMS20-IR301]WNS45178.1 opine metallophore biosynthesis dehydrogenase [Paenibacillus sp. MMS20-IR301]
MDGFKRVLLLGTGPAAVQLAVLIKNDFHCELGLAGRVSSRSELFMAALHSGGNRLYSRVQNESHQLLEGECCPEQVFHGYETVTGSWDTIILNVTADAYLSVLSSLNRDVLAHVKCILLISPTLGSNSLVHKYIQKTGLEAEVISCSTYLGDTRWIDGQPSNCVLTTAVKRKLFIGSTHVKNINVNRLTGLYDRLDIMLEVMKSPLEAESRNISLFVHPALFMNDFSLNTVFRQRSGVKYVYKLFPEGPVTYTLIHEMLECWKELSVLFEALNLKSMNLLKFMTEDNYPVRTESLPQASIDSFISLEPVHQEYLLYIRYASLLIDPFSEPDSDGRYYDFSAVPIQSIFTNRDGAWDVPRMPKEDYYRTKIIQGLARHLKRSCPTIDTFIDRYEQQLMFSARLLQGQNLSGAFQIQAFSEDIQLICSDLTV